jgi:transcriptional regulator with XRE-family HTH domain
MDENNTPSQGAAGEALSGLSIGEQLRKMRLAAGYDQDSFAQAINISVAQLNQLESNQGFLFRDYKASALALRRAFTLLETGDAQQSHS